MKRLILTVFCIALVLLPVSLAQAQQAPQAIRILHINDFHGFALPYKSVGATESLGGIAYLAGAVDKLRQEKPSLLLAAGDMIQGDNWANLFQGKSVIDLMNAMKFDAMVVGNHEFDFGLTVLRKRIRQARFPILGANVEGFSRLKPYTIKKIHGVKVGIIGVVTQDTAVSTHPRNVAGLHFIAPEAAVQKYLPELRKKADLIVVLSHLGLSGDMKLAQKVRGIDVIIGGHTHTKLLQPVTVGATIIAQAWEHGKALGVLDLTVKDGNVIKFHGYLQKIRPTGNADQKIENLVAKYSRKVDARLNKTIGKTEVDLDGEQVRTRETNLGDLIADIMRDKSGAQVAIINGGGIRTSINQGVIRVRDVYSVLPFNNYLIAIRLTGRQLQEALEHGVSGLEEKAGRFPQVSGLSFTYDPRAPSGSRIKAVVVGGQPLAPDQDYVVATNDFLVVGGDGYKVFGEAIKAAGDYSDEGKILKSKNLVYNDPGTWLRDVVIDYIKARKKIGPRVEGRIKVSG